MGNKGSIIPLERNRGLDALVYLQGTKQPRSANENRNINSRRASVAGGELFSINDSIREAGFDYFRPVLSNSTQSTTGMTTDAIASTSSTTTTTKDMINSHDKNGMTSTQNVSPNAINSTLNGINSSDDDTMNTQSTSSIAMVSVSTTNGVINSQDDDTMILTQGISSIAMASASTTNGVIVSQDDDNMASAHGSNENNDGAGIDESNVETAKETNENDNRIEMESFKQNVKSAQNVLQNNFNPYRRLPNVQFIRQERANSMYERQRPLLSSIIEEEEEIPQKHGISGKESDTIQKWMKKTFE